MTAVIVRAAQAAAGEGTGPGPEAALRGMDATNPGRDIIAGAGPSGNHWL